MIDGKTLAVVLPAYNAAATLKATVDELPSIVDHRILVDDGSRDDTVAVARQLGLTTFVHDGNYGYGRNQMTCYREALRAGADIVVMVHPDYQYTPRLVTAMASMIAYDVYDVVLGSRILGDTARSGGMPLYKFFGNRILTRCQNAMTGLKLSEYHSGYRLYSVEALKRVPFEAFTNNWHFDTQIILAMAERGFRIAERPIPTYYGDEICHVNGLPYAFHCLATSYQYYRNRKRKALSYPGAMDIPRLAP